MATELSNAPLLVNFRHLANNDPIFKQFYENNNHYVDWAKPETLQQVTRSTLLVYFKIDLVIPPGRLCPPVPIRFEYIRWLQGLIDSTMPTFSRANHSDEEVVGFDIGTGACCIYPLLGCATRSHWKFVASDIDSYSLRWSADNIMRNKLHRRINICLANNDENANILESFLAPYSSYEAAHFVMCNPPFYESESDMKESAENKILPPSAPCTGTESEMITPGGDLGFAKRILNASIEYKDRIRWYSCMFGKFSNVGLFVSELKTSGITNWAIGCLSPGSSTRRLVVGWSFLTFRPGNDIARCQGVQHQYLPFPTRLEIKDLNIDPEVKITRFQNAMTPYEENWTWRKDAVEVLFKSKGDIWSRAARHKRQRMDPGEQTRPLRDSNNPDFAVSIEFNHEDGIVTVDWLKGEDHIVFESFFGMLKRGLATV